MDGRRNSVGKCFRMRTSLDTVENIVRNRQEEEMPLELDLVSQGWEFGMFFQE